MKHESPRIHYGFLHSDNPVHQHHCWEIHLFTGGKGCFTQDGRVDTVEEGSLFISPPSCPHGIQVEKALSFFYIQFFSDEETESPLARLYQRQVKFGPSSRSGPLAEEPQRIKRKLEQGRNDLALSGLHHFRSWLYELACPEAHAGPSDGVERAMAFMRERLDQKLTLDALAHIAGMDRFHFCRRFKARTGLPPIAWFLKSKVEAACFLLADKDNDLSEIASRLGFSDEFHFSKVFSSRTGMPPGRFRNELTLQSVPSIEGALPESGMLRVLQNR